MTHTIYLSKCADSQLREKSKVDRCRRIHKKVRGTIRTCIDDFSVSKYLRYISREIQYLLAGTQNRIRRELPTKLTQERVVAGCQTSLCGNNVGVTGGFSSHPELTLSRELN